MDKKEPGKESPEEVTRESLIELSYQVPDENDLTVENSPKRKASEEVIEPPNCDGHDTYRSKLISISYTPPPSDVKVLPGQPNGYLDCNEIEYNAYNLSDK